MTPFRVVRKALIAEGVHLFELADAEGRSLPAFSAGAHVTLLTPNGMTRRYSLCNGPRERERYVIAVKREAQGQGGSASVVDGVQVGDVVQVSAPSNHFALDPQAMSVLLIAGGIGITPILAMALQLQAQDADFRLVYLTRSPAAAPFLDLLSAPALAGRVLVHHDEGEPARSLNLAPLLAEQAPGAQLYCCGPRALMHAVRDHSRHWPPAAVHFEDFGHADVPAPLLDRAFEVALVRAGITVAVPAGVSILAALRRHHVVVPSSCESGTCGTCRTGLVSGVAEHRDFVLDDDEQRQAIMICVSRALSPRLELDL
jgi:phthalate 4,5-dioxygenase reductase subunit